MIYIGCYFNPISNVILHTHNCSIELANILYSEF